MYVLGIDAGTTTIKAALFDYSGTAIAQCEKNATLIQSEAGCAEQDMNAIWSATSSNIHELLTISKVAPNDIAAVGITGQSGGTLLLDEANNPLKMLTWRDQRSTTIVKALKNAGKEKEFYEITGWPLWPEFASVQLAWLATHNPDLLNRARTLFSCSDWIAHCLTHERKAAASSFIGFVDSKTGTYSQELLRLCGIDKYGRLLPELVDAWETFGTVDNEAARATGVRQGTPVVSAGYDVACCAAGAKGVSDGASVCVLGTSGTNLVVCDRPIEDASRSIVRAYHIVPSHWLAISESMTAVPNVSWFIQQFCSEERETAASQRKSIYEVCDAQVTGIDSQPSEIIYHPYVSGETGPFIDFDARASFFGLTLSHTKAHMLRAIYEGVAYSIRHNFSRLDSLAGIHTDTPEIVIVGGGAMSDVWCQIIANVLNRPIVTIQSQESGCLGAAMGAAVATKSYPTFQAAAESFVRFNKRYTPNPEAAQRYVGLYEVYLQLIESYSQHWDALTSLRNEQTH